MSTKSSAPTSVFVVEGEDDRRFLVFLGFSHAAANQAKRLRKYFTRQHGRDRLHAETAAVPVQTGQPGLLPSAERDATVPQREPAELATERHYSRGEIAAMWNISEDTVTAIFENEPDVMWIQKPAKHKRRY
ncbi:MAG: hypothetical protein WA183_19335, partial [Chthoniobacterales bacterium]